MIDRSSSTVTRSSEITMKVKAFLTTVMSLLSIFVFGLGCVEKNVLWLWIGFLCSVVSGVFVQLFINRKKTYEAASGRK